MENKIINTTNNTIKKQKPKIFRWIVLFLVLVWFIDLTLKYFGICLMGESFKKDQFTAGAITYSVGKYNGEINSIIDTLEVDPNTGKYDEKEYWHKVRERVKKYYEKYPNHVNSYRITKNFFNYEERYGAAEIYFYPPEEIKQVNEYARQNKRVVKDNRTIVGIVYGRSYSTCGKPSFAMTHMIFEGNPTDIKYNPYKKKSK